MLNDGPNSPLIAATLRDRPVRGRAFSLIELLVAILIIAILIGLVLPSLGRARDVARQTQCAANLRGINRAILSYAEDNKSHLPRVIWDPSRTLGNGAIRVQAGRLPHAPNPFFVRITNDVTAGLFLLVRGRYTPTAVYVDPSTDQVPDDLAGAQPNLRSNFTNLSENLSYAYLNPYPDPTSHADGYSFTIDHIEFQAQMPIIGDSNPGCCGNGTGILTNDRAGEPGKEGNSNNHKERGQNLAYGDGHVAYPSSAEAGIDGDNVYIRQAEPTDTMLSPRTRHDAVLLPTDDH